MKDKQLSNPFSMGGGGVHFEAHIQASFVILMLTGGVAPCLSPWPITEIKLQGKVDGYNTDDLIVLIEEPVSKKKRKLLGQIKHRISITQGDKMFSEVIRAAWSDFNNSEVFNRGKDIIALITGPLSATDFYNVQWLLNQARHTKDVEEFKRQVTRANFSPSKSEEKLNVIRYHLKMANNGKEVIEEELYSFLNHFYLVGYDLGEEEGVILALLHSHISQYNRQNPQMIWSRVVDIVHTWNKDAGTITLAKLPDDLKDIFKQPNVTYIPTELITQPEQSKVDWRHDKNASTIALVNLIGAWNDNNESDVEIVTSMVKKEYAVWISQAREMLQSNDGPLLLQNGVWKINNRVFFWDMLGSRILDRDLDAFKNVAVSILIEIAPAFELAPENRFAASIYGKVSTYSAVLRKGLADSLALLGNRGGALTNCSSHKAENTVILAIREIFENAGWKLWGSLNDLLPTLAEAAPDEFLNAVENAMVTSPCLFDELFAQEGQGIAGSNYLTGLLWALEGIAWDEQYLVRVCVVLGELASHDPGGNWANRPANSLATILLPWLPQTLAPIEKRKVAVQTLYREWPEITWNLLIDLLPNQHQLSTGAYRPVWRNTIPEDWEKGVSQEEYWEQVSFYGEMLVAMAEKDISKLGLLIEHLNDLPKTAFDNLLLLLSSENILALSEGEKYPLWEKLFKFAKKHRYFSDAGWALKDDSLLRIEAITEKLTPSHPSMLYKHLFMENDFELYEEKDNWEEQSIKLDKRRQEAVKEILNSGGLNEVIKFVEEVESSMTVGNSLGSIADKEIDLTLLPRFLDSTNNKYTNFISGYIWRRRYINDWSWVDSLDKTSWSTHQVSCLLTFLPFTKETWDRATKWLKSYESDYWQKVNFNPFQANEDVEIAIDKLLVYGRPFAAIDCMNTMRYLKMDLSPTQCIKALTMALSSSEPSHLLNTHHIIELIKLLQNSTETSEKDLINVEWAYLRLLYRNNRGKPKILENALSSDPEFFCEMIRLVYRSKKSDEITELNEQTKALADNAWHLLRNWTRVPGAQEDAMFDGLSFVTWLQSVKEICSESGHLEVALAKIGEVLIYTPADPDGLWINHFVAQELNSREAEDMRSGFSTGIYNSRGAHWVDSTAKPELELAEQYRKQAEDIENAGYHRFAITLRKLSETYDIEANRIIKEHSIDIIDD
ncbi:hypothetical protein [Paenibacillus polymyxa]|uniref:hypothetical protein n=1 Tax=Paenibacillus polymyxa TaxID=1406 RepID=UPI0004DFBBCD|nr:hypothetical protein [Paenibacillus polymyxa]